MTRPVPKAAIDLAKSFEKCRLTCYDDGYGNATIGWGSTKGLTKADIGVKTITQEQADILLERDFADAAEEAHRQIGDDPIAAMTDNQWGAICDFYFNLGSLKQGSDFLAVLKAKRFDAVPAEFARYDLANGKKSLGLVRRRNAERELWSTGEPGTQPETPSSSATRALPTPPAVSSQAATPLHQQPAFVAKCIGAACSLTAAAQPAVNSVAAHLSEVHDKIAPLADANKHVGQVDGWIVGVIAAAFGLGVLIDWLEHLKTRQESAGAPDNIAKPPPPAPVPVVAPVPAAPETA